MKGSQLARWTPLGGIVFVVLLLLGTFLIGDHPDPDASEQEILDYLGDSDVHTQNIIGLYVWVLAGVGLLCFLSRLRAILRAAEGGTGTLSNLGFAAGVVFTALLMAGSAVIAAVAGAIEFRDAPDLDPDFVRVLPQMGYTMFLVGGGFSAIVLVLTTSVLTLQTGVFPQWLAWLGFVAAFVLLFAVIFVPMIALLIWVLAVSAMLLMRGEEPVTAAA
jgi:hypothetical protein